MPNENKIQLNLNPEQANLLFNALNTAMMTKGYEHGVIAVPVMNSLKYQFEELQKAAQEAPKKQTDAAVPVQAQNAE